MDDLANERPREFSDCAKYGRRGLNTRGGDQENDRSQFAGRSAGRPARQVADHPESGGMRRCAAPAERQDAHESVLVHETMGEPSGLLLSFSGQLGDRTVNREISL